MPKKITSGTLAEALTDQLKSFIDAYVGEKFMASDDGEGYLNNLSVAIQDTLLDLIDAKIEAHYSQNSRL